MLIKACLNGSREPGAHPALPVTPKELAHAAWAAVDAGAGALHIHPRRADGTQGLDADTVGAALEAVRAACPGVAVGGTTIATIAADSAERLALVRGWRVKPDFVSVNFSEDGAIELVMALLEIGVGVEPGLSNPDDVRLLLSSAIAPRCVRLLLEPDEQDGDAAIANARAMAALLDEALVATPRLLHGSDAAAWPVLDAALAWGYDTRIGLEDVLVLPDGNPARDNAQLVAAAVGRRVTA